MRAVLRPLLLGAAALPVIPAGTGDDDYSTELSPADFSATPAGAEASAKSSHAHLEPFGSYLNDTQRGVGRLAEGTWLVKFYSANCGHCSRLQPFWEALGTRPGGDGGRGYRLGAIDCKFSDEHLDACAKIRDPWQRHGWPSVVVFRNGRVLGGMKRQSRIRDIPAADGADILAAFVQRALGQPLDSKGRKLLRAHFSTVPGKEFIPDCDDGCGGSPAAPIKILIPDEENEEASAAAGKGGPPTSADGGRMERAEL